MCQEMRFFFPDPHQVCVRYMEDWPLALPPVETGLGNEGISVSPDPHMS